MLRPFRAVMGEHKNSRLWSLIARAASMIVIGMTPAMLRGRRPGHSGAAPIRQAQGKLSICRNRSHKRNLHAREPYLTSTVHSFQSFPGTASPDFLLDIRFSLGL